MRPRPRTRELPERRPGELHQGRDRGEEGARRSRPGATLAEPDRSETYFPDADGVTFVFLIIVNTIRDILVNLLSSALWDWCVLLFTCLVAFLKKPCRVHNL
jgi:hypothetical protein